MKNKELKALIKNKADNIIINNRSKSILSKVNYQSKLDTNSKKKNKFYIPLFATMMAVLIGVFVYIAIPKNQTDPLPTKAKEKLAYEVAALGNVVNSKNVLAMKMARMDENEAKNIANEVHNYLLTGEMMLNKNDITAMTIENNDENYDFEYKMDVKYSDNTSFETEYTLYYSEYKKVESDYFIDEVSSYLNGIMIIDGEKYEVKGEKEIEKDEMETSLTIFTDSNSYVKISQGIENTENEYEYEFVENGKELKSLSLEVEEKLLKKSMSISIEEGKIEKEYEFEYHKNYIECKFEDDTLDEEYKIRIEIYKEYYIYMFTNDIQIKINK